MKFTTRSIVFFMFLSAFCRPVRAQESMMSEVSLVYLEKLIATAKENYPRMRNFNDQVARAKVDIGRQSVSWFDFFNLSYVRQPENNVTVTNPITGAPETGSSLSPVLLNGFQFGVGINLGTLFQKPYNVRQSKIDYRIAQTNREEYVLTLEAEVKRRYYLYVQTLEVLKLQTKGLVDIQNTFRDLRAKYEKGAVTFSEYNTGLTSVSAQTQSKITAEGAFLTAKVALEEMLGKRLEEIK
ncbi:TolC family protein [Pedobacter sp. SYP-B3415]|uniref:TolC family protein n=1 Tax=Pedobacter sp. SYP-B3415 TaxID=2496641 RepID=UPI00101CC224|nr:TolC family protein [Pedobacter sp. SYP-B3415]